MKKTIQDIYIVKKNIKILEKDSTENNFSVEKKIPDEENFSDNLIKKIPFKNIDDEEKINTDNTDKINDDEYIEEKKYITKDFLFLLWIICIASIAVLLFLLSSTFATAVLTITPRSENFILNDTYIISSDKNNADNLHYETMTIEKDLSKILETNDEEFVERKAIGKVILFNNFNISQKLINNTRIETKEGLIYRIRESINIPGIKMIDSVQTPGSVEVEIIADMPGNKYNMKLSDLKGDFTIPGFKGSAKYATFYGRLSADINGGFIGKVKKVSEEKLITDREELKNILKDKLIKEIYSKKPEQYILFKNNYYMQCEDLSDEINSNEFKISEKCSINAIIFDKEKISSFIAKNKIKDFDNSKINIIWNDNIIVALSGETEKPWNETSLKANLIGNIQIVYLYNIDEILNSILSQDKSVINSVMENNKNSLIEIQAVINPIWVNTFPKNIKKIKIIDSI